MSMKNKILDETKNLPDAGLVNHFFDFQYLSLKKYPDKIILFGQSEALSEMNRYSEVHNRFCMIVAVTGGLRVIVEGAPIYIRENEGLLLFPYQNHSFPHEDKDSVLFFITFEQADYSQIEAIRNQRFAVKGEMFENWSEIFDCWNSLAKNPQKVWQLSTNIRQFLLGACSNLLENDSPEVFMKLREMFKDRQFMTWKIKEVARHFQCSPSYLNRICKENIGITLGEYLRNLRFDFSVNLICSTNLDIKEIADQSGFLSFPSFCRQFKKRFGESPTETRKRFHRKEFRLRYDGFSENT